VFPRDSGIVDFNELVFFNGSSGVNPLARFFKHVELSDDCWLWKGSNNRSYKSDTARYGRFRLSSNPSVVVYAHRFIYAFVHGPIPESMEVHHNCFNSLCVNPLHLEAATVEFNHGTHAPSSPNEIPF